MTRSSCGRDRRPASAGLAVAAALLLAATAQAGPRRALLIGNDDYPGGNRLESCVNDAKAVREWLLAAGYQEGEITLLTDARKVDMSRAIEALAEACRKRPHDQVVFYYSGHGITVADENGDEGPDDGTDEGLVGVDDPATARSWSDLVLLDDDLYRAINAIVPTAQQVVVMLDSCYSGGSIKTIGGAGGRSKQIDEWALRAALEEAGVATGPLRTREAATRGAKGIQGAGPAPAPPGELQGPPAGHALVFLSSSNQYQTSASGKPLSAFTDAFLAGLLRERGRLAGADGSIGMDAFRAYLDDTLRRVPQSPVIATRGLATGARLVPDVFADPVQAELSARLAGILETVLGLPAEDPAGGWDVAAAPSRPGRLPVGTKFALRVRPSQDGCLVAFTVSPEGSVTFLFPNRFRPDNAVTGGKEVLLPYPDGLQIQPPVGIETYYVYLVDPEHNPFDGFPLGQLAGPLAVGRLDDVVRRMESKGRRVELGELRSSLGRGIAVEAVRRTGDGGGKPAPEPPAHWARAVVKVESVER